MTSINTSRLLAATALLFIPAALGPPPGGPFHATIALVAELPDPHARASLIVRAGTGDGVIMLRERDASVTDLAAAVLLLERTRRNEPVPLTRDRQIVVKIASIARPLSPGVRQRLTAQLARLRSAPPRDVEGVGVVPAIDVHFGRKPPA